MQLSNKQLTINVSPSVSFEKKIDDNSTLVISGGMDFTSVPALVNDAYIGVIPYVATSYRRYYTRKRIKKDNLRNNSGNYLGLFTIYNFDALGDHSGSNTQDLRYISKVGSIGPVWGIQRNYASGIHLGVDIGPGLAFSDYFGLDVTLVGRFEFGFVLFPNK